MGHVNEEWLADQRADHELLGGGTAYGYPEITDITTTEYGPTEGIEVQPQWDVPQTIAITAAVVGGFFSKRQNPNHPIQPDEIRAEAEKAIEAGATSVHLHVRDPETGINTVDRDLYREVVEPLQEEHPEMVFDAFTKPNDPGEWDTVEGIYEDELFEVSPVNTTATYLGDFLFYEPPDELIARTRLLKDHGMKPQMAIYNMGDVDNARRYLVETGEVEEPYCWIVLPALPGCTPMPNPNAMVENLVSTLDRIREIPGEHEIVVCAAGRASSYLATFAIIMGCHIRVGMEDTIYKYPHRDDRIEDNGEDVAKYRKLANTLGRTPATPDRYRDMIGL